MKYGIALIPNPDLIEYLIRLQDHLAPRVALAPALGTQTNLPHISLIQGLTGRRSAMQAMLGRLHGVLSAAGRPLDLSLTRITHVEIGWFFWKVAQDAVLLALHDRTFALSKPFLKPPATYDAEYITTYSEIERRNFLRYGYRYIGQAYKPHVTIGRSRVADPPTVLARLETYRRQHPIAMLQRFARLTLFGIGPNGAHQETVAAFEI